ncbi:hypothetical protein [Alienimonas californiensis]|uniref:Uncharacterized protein n=1 Tax=Alienimonas californiensis TaxID=2527989 RepID=A0A517P6B5_9PLAN|nr:hypothetical protein [Alienimonas californiensis]QDT14896.1 hypothetical protein CA12_09760 [Alienimonas californiensis]
MSGDARSLRFALLAHDWPTPGFPNPHFDLLIEDPALVSSQGAGERRCRTWRLRADPRSGAAVEAEPIAPHRAFYLTHEGPVSGGRGTVVRLDGGTAEWDATDPAVVVLGGGALAGRWRAADGVFGPA